MGVKRKKQKQKKSNSRVSSSVTSKGNKTKSTEAKGKKFDSPSVILPEKTITERFTENTKVPCPPFEVHAYGIPDAILAYETQCRFGPSQQLPLILHSLAGCLADQFEEIERNFDLNDKLLNKQRAFTPVRLPDLPPQLQRQLQKLTFGLFGNKTGKWVDIIMKIPGMRHLILEMDLQTTSVRECEDGEDLLPIYCLDKSMTHLGHIIVYINRRIVEMQHPSWSPLSVKRLVQMNNCYKTRFCLNLMLSEFLVDLYSKDQFKKYFLENDILPSLFVDMVELPKLTDRILDYFFSLSERAWYEASEAMVHNAFDRVFLPWVDGNLYLHVDLPEFDADLQTLLWHVMSNQHFVPLIESGFIDHPLIAFLKTKLGENKESEFTIDQRERLFNHVGSFRSDTTGAGKS